MVTQGGEIIPIELTKLMCRNGISLLPELLQRFDRFCVFRIQRIDVLQNSLCGAVTLRLLVHTVGLMLLLLTFRLRLILHSFIFKGWEAETDVLSLPDDVVLDFAKLLALRQWESLPWGVVTVALVQFLMDLIPHLIALRDLRQLRQRIHDGIDKLLQRLLEIAILFLSGGRFQCLHKLTHVVRDDRAVADLVLHPADHFLHGILRCLHQV